MDFEDTMTTEISPWEGGVGPEELLFEEIEVCPIDDHLTCGIAASELCII
ncbi:MAG: hypothetical protein IKR19_08435 [Acholeplasmatales bacterium]|nr:hypothetical protein [Acholeplasmatales bacterium]